MKNKPKKLTTVFLLFLVILSPFSYADAIDNPEVQDVTLQTNDLEGETDSVRYKIAGIGSSQSIQWNKIDRDSTPKINAEGQIFNNDLFSGSASYSYAIEVPPGVNELEPLVVLSYNHYNTNSISGVLGTGWSLNNNFIERDVNYTLSDISDDFFWINLNGVRDKLVYVSHEGRYHTEYESDLNIRKLSTSNNDNGDYWIIILKDGTRYEFGNSQDSEQVSNQKEFVTKWSLSSITDKNGNRINYNYIENLNNGKGTIHLESINYNNGINVINFEYVLGVADKITIFSNGNEIKNMGVLKTISAEHDGNLVRKYVLEYSRISTKLFLTKIREFGMDGVSELPSVEFTYQDTELGWQRNNKWKLPLGAEFGSQFDRGVRLMDVNADGLIDITSSTSADIFYWLNTGDGWGRLQSFDGMLSNGFVDPNYGDTGTRFVDINGDGRTDIIQITSGDNSIRNLLINNGNGFYESGIPSIPGGIALLSVSYSCNPGSCSSGWKREEINCDEFSCTRTCTYEKDVCGNNWRVVFEDEGDGYSNSRNDREDYTRSFIPSSSNKCYAFTVDTPNEVELEVNEDECVEGRDYDGESVFIAGLRGENDNSWLKTVPPKNNDEKWHGNLENSYSNADFYYSYITSHEASNGGNFDSGDINSFARDNEILYCTPSQNVCTDSGLGLCGYGCLNQETEAFVQSGYYRDRGDWFENIARDYECDDSNVYEHEADDIRMVVHEASLVKQDFYEQTSCLKTYKPNDWGVRLVDVDGDGKTDIMQAFGDLKKVFINKGSRFIEDSRWIIPNEVDFASSSGSDNGLRLVDINGDGLIDIVLGNEEKREIWLNNGEGWSLDNSLVMPEDAVFSINGETKGVVIADINGDGLNDFVKAENGDRKTWISTGTGWGAVIGWKIPSNELRDFSTQIADVNGDGMVDVIFGKSQDDKITFIKMNSGAYLLKEIKNGQGGRINIEYEKLSSFDNTGNDNINDISFNGWVVKSIIEDNGVEGEHAQISTSSYHYKGGVFDPASREFRGFAEVVETLPDSTRVIHKFYQDDERKGLEHETIILDEDGNIHKKIEREFVVVKQSQGYKIVRLHFVRDTLYGEDNEKATGVRLYYDLYGNLVRIHNLGFLDVEGDEKEEKITYGYDLSKWIVDKLLKYALYDASGSKQSEIFYMYDDNMNLIKEEYWLDNGVNPSVNYEYDDYGNVISETNPSGNTIHYTYDSTNTFVIKEKNPMNFETRYEYDKSNGNILSVTDPNGYVTSYLYDDFGRKIKEILPYGSIEYPTQEIIHEFDGDAPEKITVRQREENGRPETYDEIYFYDGFGRLIQLKREGEDSRHILHNVFYDEMDREKVLAFPYFAEQSNDFSVVTDMPIGYNYSYDALGRVIEIEKPDNTRIRIDYAPYRETVLDMMLNKKVYVYDAYDNIIEVLEDNEDEVYSTKYSYNTHDELVKIEDNEENEIAYTYDSLGRKIKLDDPDLGIWTYEYDKNGNLLRQWSNGRVVVSFEYDSIDRPIRKTTIDGEAMYTIYNYDRDKKDTLYMIDTPFYDVYYSYDDRYRILSDEYTIDDQTYLSEYEYDSMDRITKKRLHGNEITYSYNNQGIESIETTLVDDRVKEILSNIDYNEVDNVLIRDYGNELSSEFDYWNNDLRLYGLKTGDIQDLSYSYNEHGDIMSIRDNKNDISVYMGYDDLSRLVNVESSSANDGLDYEMHYDYDSIGNILKIVSADVFEIEFLYDKLAHAPDLIKDSRTSNELVVDPIDEVIEDDLEDNQNNEGTISDPVTSPSNNGQPEDASSPRIVSVREFWCDGVDNDNDGSIDEGGICNIIGDFDNNGAVDFDDFFKFSDVFGLAVGEDGWKPEYGIYDLTGDGKIDYDDYFMFSDEFNGEKVKND